VSKKHTETPGSETQEHHKREEEGQSIIGPIIDDLKGQTKTHYPSDDELGAPNPPGPGDPPQPPDLDQDAAAGDNPDDTDPQS
jgi:hypothetical protein